MKTSRPQSQSVSLILLAVMIFLPVSALRAQDPVTGAIEGYVFDSATKSPIAGALVQFINAESGAVLAKRTNDRGYYRQGLLPPGEYRIRVSMTGYAAPRDQLFTNYATKPNEVRPPVYLVAETSLATTTPTPSPTDSPTTAPTNVVQASASTGPPPEQPGIESEINTTDARRGGAYTDKEVSTLPLGGTTLTRTFDELALLLPGVAPPPETQGSVAGPGVGPGVGSAGQFSVNGMRSRANNFTVDGSDNNDEDIGVRRQGFFALVPQPIESIQEYQVTTLLAPAQYGRNMGAQVNAVSKSGGNQTHGTVYGFINSSRLNSPNVFDTTSGNTSSALTVGTRPVLRCATFVTTPSSQNCPISAPITVNNSAGEEDSLTLGQGGVVIGGPLVPNHLFYFFSGEGAVLHATKEVNFAVPTVAQRGLFNSGATGLTFQPFWGLAGTSVGDPNFFYPTSLDADYIFGLFPFPNNPNGVYGANTFSQAIPANAEGLILSGKVSSNFSAFGKSHELTTRYNFTNDWRDIPAVGGALFARVRPRIRTQNLSTFLNTAFSGSVYNQFRASYGRTRLTFDEGRDTEFQIPSDLSLANPAEEQFLLNARALINFTLPNFSNCPVLPCAGVVTPSTGPIIYVPSAFTIQEQLGPIGQVHIAGFSPVGVDVFNFPQRRVNNTYQVADTLTWSVGRHNFAFGADVRRTELNSELPRNYRPLITFYGAPRAVFNFNPATGISNFAFSGFISPLDLAAASAPTGVFQTLKLPGISDSIGLRYYQLNFFGQDDWRVTQNLSISFGLRYEYNTPPREVNRQIESTFNSSSLSIAPAFRNFINGRTEIYDADRNNFAPRVGFAYSSSPFGENTTVIRAGYGLFYDQILGAVVSQSRNVFPRAITTNFAGGFGGAFGGQFDIFNPSASLLVAPGTLNTLDLGFLNLPQAVNLVNVFCAFTANASCLGLTLPARQLEMPMAHHYSVTFEQQLSDDLVFSAAYVGTQGRNLLRLTTPNLGANAILVSLYSDELALTPTVYGAALQPGERVSSTGIISGGRPTPGIGPVNIYTTDGESRYDALQLQLRGRFGSFGSSSTFQAAYTYGKVKDDVSDVFDLAGAPALPQNSRTSAGEYSWANFDVRHRFAYNYLTDFSNWGRHNSFAHFLFDGLQIAGTGVFQTGQPFTVNSIFDVNLDGNLTDRLNSVGGIQVTGDRAQPLRLTGSPASLLAPIGQDGSVPRNSFRASNLWLTNLAVIKNFKIRETNGLTFRMDIFNLLDRANYAIPVWFLEAPGFGRATETVTPGRRIQFGLKFSF